PRTALETLNRRIGGLGEPKDAPSRKRRALLWQRLGLLRRDVDRSARAAIYAFEQAVALDPDLRGQLVELYEDGRAHGPAALAHHRALLFADPLRAASLRAVARIYVESFEAVKARAIYQVLELAAGLTEDERAWLAADAAPAFDADSAYAGVLDDADHARLAHPDARTLAEVFEALREGAPNLLERGFAPYGCRPQDRLSPVSPLPAALVFGQLARALGNKKTGLYLKADRGLDGIVIISQPPTGVLIGPRIAHETPPSELRFLLGRAVALARPEYILAETAERRSFAVMMQALLRAFHPRHARLLATDPLAAKLRKQVPVIVAKRLHEWFRERAQATFSSARWRLAVRQTANRMGLLACGDLSTAVRILVRENEPDLPDRPEAAQLSSLLERSPQFGDLLRWALSEEYLAAYARLWR
ncbi:MAG TPA: hypothetical protein VKN99_18445, partial [Polyangia bacterium]|nr:hypothetical protein [Polyangia bacterium]